MKSKKPEPRGFELMGVYQNTRSQLAMRKSSVKREQKEVSATRKAVLAQSNSRPTLGVETRSMKRE